jgi:DNA-binding NtrC family response regulator
MSTASTGAGTSSGRGGLEPCAPNTCLIVEDQALIGLALEAYLEEIGLEACELLPSVNKALAWLAGNTPALAILDYSLRDGSCLRLARVLQERGIPFVIYSGQQRNVAPPELQHVPWINKPCDREVLLAALTRAAPALSERLSRAA